LLFKKKKKIQNQSIQLTKLNKQTQLTQQQSQQKQQQQPIQFQQIRSFTEVLKVTDEEKELIAYLRTKTYEVK